MARNGSHPLEFEFDADCSYFMVRLLVHPTAVEVANSVQNDQLDATAGTRSAPSRRQVEILQQCGQERALADLMAHIDRTRPHQVQEPGYPAIAPEWACWK